MAKIRIEIEASEAEKLLELFEDFAADYKAFGVWGTGMIIGQFYDGDQGMYAHVDYVRRPMAELLQAAMRSKS